MFVIRWFIPTHTDPTLPSRAAVVGAGEMGPGIALSFAQARVDVTLIDQSTAQLDDAADELARVTDLLADTGELSDAASSAVLDRIDTATDIAAAADADYIAEAVTEELEVKRECSPRSTDTARRASCLRATVESGYQRDRYRHGAARASHRYTLDESALDSAGHRSGRRRRDQHTDTRCGR